MIENEAMLSAISEDPDDDSLRLVYADWLEEHGQPDRSRLIRLQIEMARLPDNTEPPTALEVEEEQLLEAIDELVVCSLLDTATAGNHVRYSMHQLTRQFVTSELPQIWKEQGLS